MKLDISQASLYGISDEAALELIEWRKSIKKPLTQRALERAFKEALKCREQLGIKADKAIEIAIDKGWQGVTFEYIKSELSRRSQAENNNGTHKQAIGHYASRSERSEQTLNEYMQGIEQREGGSNGLADFEVEATGSFRGRLN